MQDRVQRMRNRVLKCPSARNGDCIHPHRQAAHIQWSRTLLRAWKSLVRAKKRVQFSGQNLLFYSFMIFRLSQKLIAKFKAGAPAAALLNANPLADWSAQLFAADRTQYILLSNTKTLYSTMTYASGISTAQQFIPRALGSIREVMETEGHAHAYERFVAPATGSVRFAKGLNRSVTGSITELVKLAKIWLVEKDLSPHDVALKLNVVPMSAISTSVPGSHGLPRNAFQAMLIAAADGI